MRADVECTYISSASADEGFNPRFGWYPSRIPWVGLVGLLSGRSMLAQ